MTPSPQPEATAWAARLLSSLRDNIRLSIRGKDAVIDQVLVALAAGGHVLIEDLPGLGKTTLAYALARSLDADFSRIQFTSDLLPADVTGVSVYDDRERRFIFRRGPVFANIVLADEINRATPKTQSALLEVMDRGRVSVDGETHSVGSPFLVFATQNPVDHEGAFTLPDSQLDRFLLRLQMGYPGEADELEILRGGRGAYDAIPLNPVAARDDMLRLQRLVHDVFAEDSVLAYLQRLLAATRSEPELRSGASVRAGLALKAAAQARALLSGREYLLPGDVSMQLIPVLAHRLFPRRSLGDPIEERRLVESILARIALAHPEPL